MIKKALIWLGGIFVALIALGAMVGEPEGKTGQSADTAVASAPSAKTAKAPVEDKKEKPVDLDAINDLHPYFANAQEGDAGQRLVIEYRPKQVWDGKRWVYGFFEDALSGFADLDDATNGKAYKSVQFYVYIPTTDRLGNSDMSLGMVVEYNMAQLKGAKWKSMTGWDMASLPEKIVFKRFGLESAVEYCQDESNLKFAQPFCLRVASELKS